MSTKLDSAIDELGQGFEHFKNHHNDRLADVEDRLGIVEAHRQAVKYEARVGSGPSRVMQEFGKDLRALAKGDKGSLEVPYSPQMSVTTADNISAQVLGGLDIVARRTSPIMNLCRNVNSSTGNYAHIVADDDAAGAWVAEGSARAETDTSTFQKVTPTGNVVYAYPKISEEALDDNEFDLGNWLVEESGRIIGQLIGTAIVNGTGTEQPTGFLYGNTTSPLTIVNTTDTASPRRAFTQIQYLPTGVAANFQQDRLGSPQGDPSAVLVNALYALPSTYRANATWVMNSTTLATIKKWRDADGNLIMVPGLVSGQDSVLFGKPILVCEDMPSVGAGAIPIAIADWNQAYVLLNVGGVRVTVNPYSAAGYTSYYVRRRIKGAVLNTAAIRVVKCSVS